MHETWGLIARHTDLSQVVLAESIFLPVGTARHLLVGHTYKQYRFKL
jgi:hypothetical protein